MNPLKSLLFTSLIFLVSNCFGQYYIPGINPYPPLIPIPPIRLEVPVFNEPTNRIAYLEQTPTRQTLKLAKLSQNFLTTEARVISTLATVELNGTTSEEIVDLLANPNNSQLASYTYQDFYDYSEAFNDHNIEIYDMLNGYRKGLINEHSFAGLNARLATSQRLQEFKQAELDYGVPASVVNDYDFRVVTEGIIAASPTYRWNTDGTFTYSILLDVEVDYGSGYRDYIGEEVFSLTVAITPSGLSRLGFNIVKTPASYPPTFAITPVSSSTEEFVRLNGSTINFIIYEFYFNGRYYVHKAPRASTMAEGNVPTAFRNLFN